MSASKVYVMEDDESSGSEEISDSEIDSFLLDKDLVENALSVPPQEFLFAPQAMSESVVLPDFACLDPDTQERLQALLQAAGITKVANEGRAFGDPELLKRLTSSVSSALDEAAAALTRMKNDDKNVEDPTAAVVSEMTNAEEGESLLSLACSAGYYELAQVLLAMRTNVEDRGSKGDCTPLMEAASAGHADIVKLLIAHGADMTAQSSTGNTPLMYACASGHEEVVRVLLKAGADVSLHNENGHTPLMEAASAGHVGIAKLLVEHGAQVNAHSAEFKVGLESPLTLACYKGHLEMVRYLLQVGGDNQSPGRQEELHTALMEASMDGHVEVARLLLDAGAQVNLPTDSFESPLTLAACGGHMELATLLLENGANLEEPNDEGYTPLMEAAREGHEETVTVLLDWGAFVNAQTEETGETALTLACCGGFQEVAVLLLNHGADIELGANTPLMEAAQEGHVDLVRYLIKRGANVNSSTASGDTPLTYAAENGHTDVCAALLDAGANLEQAADSGRTALMKSSRAGHFCTVQYLLSKGADPNKSTSGNDHCALSFACGGGHLAVVELLLQHGADPSKKLKDGTTCIMEAAKGGHTTVVQLLIDWPGPHLIAAARTPVDPNCAHTTVPPPPPALNLPSCAEASSNNNNLTLSHPSAAAVSMANVLPQFILPASLTSTGGYANLSLGYGTGLNVGQTSQQQQQSLVDTSSFLSYKDPLTQAEKALLKQASEKLSAAELQQLQELLKAQFQETAAQLANRVQATNSNAPTSRGVTGSSTSNHAAASSSSTLSSSSASSNAKSKKAELEAAMKELEQLKKTQQLYEQLQRALEQKDEKTQTTTGRQQNSKNNNNNKPKPQQQSTTNAKKDVNSSPLVLPPVPPPSPPPPPPPPSSSSSQLSAPGRQVLISRDIVEQHLRQSQNYSPSSSIPSATSTTTVVTPTISQQQQQMVSFQLPSLDPAQLQYLQQQFSLALSAQNFQFQLQQQQLTSLTSSSSSADLASPQVQQLSSPRSTVAADDTSSVNNTSHNQHVGDISSAAGELTPSPPTTRTTTGVASQTTAFNFSLPSSGFNFTPSHLLPSVGVDQQRQQTLNSNTNLPHTIYGNAAAKATQTLTTNEQTQTTTNYLPQVGAFQPTNAYSLTANLLSQTAAVLAGGATSSSTTTTLTTTTNLQQQHQQQTPQQLLRSGVDLNTQTESNHDTALTLACAGGHEELVMLLLQRGADLEHQDKKGFTPLILAATAGHAGVVELLLDHGASPEAQSERTKDTALSLACSSGKKEVVEILLKRGTNKEHRNVSDYTPLSLAASGGYTEIISLLLQYGAEINSRTGSKLGISPLMLAAMNGHVQAVKLLLEKGADINAQIETNRNTALTLACFQGRNEVVKLLLEYGANVEHRAKTGLTPLMEAASGGYVEVGRVLLHYGADPNSAPVPASRDTALTIAADKGHSKFVELLLQHGAQLDCKTKKGCTALWLACHGGYLEVVQALVKAGAGVDAQDNRKVTPLMAAFRKGHLKVVKWLVRHVQQFPSDTECTRYLTTIIDKDTMVKCKQCMETIMAAKDRQAQEANKAAAVLLQELEHEQQLAETRRQAKQRQKEKKKAKRKAKKAAQKGVDDDDQCGDVEGENEAEPEEESSNKESLTTTDVNVGDSMAKEKRTSKDSTPEAAKDSAASSRASSSRSSASVSLERCQKRNDVGVNVSYDVNTVSDPAPVMPVSEFIRAAELDEHNRVPTCPKTVVQNQQRQHDDGLLSQFGVSLPLQSHHNVNVSTMNECGRRRRRPRRIRPTEFSSVGGGGGQQQSTTNDVIVKSMTVISKAHQQRLAAENSAVKNAKHRTNDVGKNVDHTGDSDGWSKATTHRTTTSSNNQPTTIAARARGRSMISSSSSRTSAGRSQQQIINGNNNDESCTNNNNNNGSNKNNNNNVNWREVKRQSHRIYVSSQAIARVIGRGGNNINAIRESSGAHIEVEKQQKGQTDRLITIRGSSDATKQAILMINGLINEPETPVQEIVAKVKCQDTKAIESYSQARGSTGVTNAGGGNSTTTTTSSLIVNSSKSATKNTNNSFVMDKTNGFPEMTVWDPSIAAVVTNKQKSSTQQKINHSLSKNNANVPLTNTPSTSSGVTYTTATVSAKTTTVVSSAKGNVIDGKNNSKTTNSSSSPPNSNSNASMNMEYSPFSTPNVWFSCSSSNVAPHKMNFASVAAANIATTSSTTVTVTSTRVSTPPLMCSTNATLQYAAPPPTSSSSMQEQTSIGNVGDDQSKAPGYRSGVVKLPQQPPPPILPTTTPTNQQSQSLLTDNKSTSQDWYQSSVTSASVDQQQSTNDFCRNQNVVNSSSSSTNYVKQQRTSFTPPPSMPMTPNGVGLNPSIYFDRSSFTSASKISQSPFVTNNNNINSTMFGIVDGGQQKSMEAAFEADGRRSAGTLTGYFSPISLPRPASATASVNVPTDSQGGMFTPPSPVNNTIMMNNQFQNFMLPTPIGGERRSRGPSTVPTALANVLGDLSDQQQIWDAANRLNSADVNDWSSGFSGLSANLAQLQALQAMDGADFALFNNENVVQPQIHDVVENFVGYEPDYYHPAMWLAAYQHQSTSHHNQQIIPPTIQQTHQQQQQQRFAAAHLPTSFNEPPPSSYIVPADPWNGGGQTTTTGQQTPWKMMNGTGPPPPPLPAVNLDSTNFMIGHPPPMPPQPPLPPPPPSHHFRTTTSQQMPPQPPTRQHGWSGWNSVTMQ